MFRPAHNPKLFCSLIRLFVETATFHHELSYLDDRRTQNGVKTRVKKIKVLWSPTRLACRKWADDEDS